MKHSIRPHILDRDAAPMFAIMSQVWPDVGTLEMYIDGLARTVPNEIFELYCIVSEADTVRGYGSIYRNHTTYPAGKFRIGVTIDPAHRCTGLGTHLFDFLHKRAAGLGATHFEATVQEEQPQGRTFAQNRGFTVFRHVRDALLDLKTFDEARFRGVIDGVVNNGVHLTSLATLGNTEPQRRETYDLYLRLMQDVPYMFEPMDYDSYRAFYLDSLTFRPEYGILAVDAGRMIGMSFLYDVDSDKRMGNWMTGVDRTHRGRKIALALKLRTIQMAKALGRTHLRTNNADDNLGILAINNKLGYSPEPGYYQLSRME